MANIARGGGGKKKKKFGQRPYDPFAGLSKARLGPALLGSAPTGGFANFSGADFSRLVPKMGGGGPDYGGLIGGQPDLSALEAEFGAQSRADAAARDAALRRFIISYGSVPDFDKLGISKDALGFLKGALDPTTLDLARKAEEEGVSVHARQAKEDAVARRRIPALLAGRGLLRSGQTGSDLADQAQSYKNVQYDTLNEMLGGIESTVGGFMQSERDRALQLAMARMNAAWDAYDNWGDYDMGGSMYTRDPNVAMTRAPGIPTLRAAGVKPGVYGRPKPTRPPRIRRRAMGLFHPGVA